MREVTDREALNLECSPFEYIGNEVRVMAGDEVVWVGADKVRFIRGSTHEIGGYDVSPKVRKIVPDFKGFTFTKSSEDDQDS